MILSTDVWIPRGIGDVNGNGIPEILGHTVGALVLYEASSAGSNPFERIVYSDLSNKRNGAGLVDVTGDGKPEILALTDAGCIILGYVNNTYQQIGTIPNTSRPLQGSTTNRVDEISIATGDFDGDGNIEIAFSDTDGDVVIGESSNGSFRVESVLEFDGVGGSGYVTSANLNGDAYPELIIGVPDSSEADVRREYGRNLWTFRVIQSKAPNTYDVVASETFAGVRYGIGYRNGVAAGALNASPGDEVVICVFPNLYVFTWE